MERKTSSPAKTAYCNAEDLTLPDDILDLLIRVRLVTNDRILRLPSTCEKTGRSPSALWKDVSQCIFPPPIRIGPRAVGWRESEVNAWLEARSMATRSICQPFDMKVFVAALTKARA